MIVIVPLGLPGTFVQVGVALAATVLSDGTLLGWPWVGFFLVLALAGEGIEFLAGQWGARRFGGSRAAGWGALAGGLVGAIVGGIPVPVVGAVVASLVGTFLGALAGELWARSGTTPELRIGFGAVVGRVVGMATKLFLGIVILTFTVTVAVTQAWS
jgi:uncharacterized protein YqgC (DUF456 family)